jgi:tetracycline resistance efflux pump
MSWLTLLPPILAIIIAIWRQEVIIALVSAIWLSETFLHGFNPAIGFLEVWARSISALSNPGNAAIITFSVLVGALLHLIRHSGGVAAFVNHVTRWGLARSKRHVGLLPTITGVVVFIETNLSVLTAGIVSQSLFDKFNMSRARLAFIIDSTCAPISVLILLNAWGAYILGLIGGYGLENPVDILISTIPYNFYAIIIIGLVFYTSLTDKVHGPMKHAESQTTSVIEDSNIKATKARYMVLPILSMIIGIIAYMFYSGEGDLFKGDGAMSVLWATATALLVSYILLISNKVYTHQEFINHSFKGMGELLPLVATVLLALSLGLSLRELGTGEFVAAVLDDKIAVWALAPIVFFVAGVVSFTTGTSWGTFALLIPIAIPLSMSMGVPPQLVLAAVMGGGVFGDHCSPISDTTIVSSLAAGCSHLEHVNTQLPYALFAGVSAIILYAAVGFIVI